MYYFSSAQHGSVHKVHHAECSHLKYETLAPAEPVTCTTVILCIADVVYHVTRCVPAHLTCVFNGRNVKQESLKKDFMQMSYFFQCQTFWQTLYEKYVSFRPKQKQFSINSEVGRFWGSAKHLAQRNFPGRDERIGLHCTSSWISILLQPQPGAYGLAVLFKPLIISIEGTKLDGAREVWSRQMCAAINGLYWRRISRHCSLPCSCALTYCSIYLHLGKPCREYKFNGAKYMLQEVRAQEHGTEQWRLVRCHMRSRARHVYS